MENLKSNFLKAVADALLLELATLRAKDPKENQALVEFNIAGLLKQLGATQTEIELHQNKGYSFIRVKATDGGFYFAQEFSPRRSMTQAEYDSLPDVPMTDIVAVAGVLDDGEQLHTSFKWDRIVKGEETIKPSGPVRKWDGSKYDEPIIAE